MIDKLKKIKISDKNTLRIILIIIFLSMFVLNFLTPLIADDYSYALTYGRTRISNLLDIINYQAQHYMIWGGRTIAHTIAQIFLMSPKWIFNISNSIIYTLIVYYIYNFAKGKNKDDKPYLLIGIHFILYFLTPVFGENCIWLIGSCNYIWTMFIMLALIYQYKNNYDKKDSIIRTILILLLGILAGWTNENTSFGLLVIIVSMIVINKLNKKDIKQWHISGVLGNIIGFAIMILAPGNFVRKQQFVEESNIVVRLAKRIIECTGGIYTYCFILVALLIILISIYIYNHKKINSYVYSFILGGVFSIYPMVLSPEFPERSWFGVIVFLTVAVAILLYNLEDINKVFRLIIIDSLIVLTIVFVKDYYSLVQDIRGLRSVWNERREIIENANKDETIELNIYYTNNKKNPNYGIADLVTDPYQWPNTSVSDYYGVEEIKGIETY